MHKRIQIKNHHQEIQLIMQRIMMVLAVMMLLVFGLVVRLGYLQIYKQDMYTTLSTKNWLDLVPIEPTRGLIYDRNGILLAENLPVFSLDVIPSEATELSKSIIALKKIIALSDNDVNQFERQLRQHRRFDEIPLKLRLSDDEVARFTENQHRFHGFMIKARLMRHYPYNNSFSHVMGYVGRINAEELNEIDQTNYSASHYIGKSGIEKYYEEDLHGSVGYQQVENDASGKSIRVLKEIKGIPGKNIYLTIDSQLQFVAEKALADHRGAIVVIQPATGQVLAMVSQPSFDPNLFVLGIGQKDFQALQNSPDRPLYNRAVRGQYMIASTIKPYLALAGLEANVISPETTIYDQGWFQLPNSEHIFHDWVKNGHGSVSLPRAIMQSCDIFFYELAMKLGIHRMDEMLSRFGFGAVTGIDLDDELPGVLASPEWKQKNKGVHWYPGDTVISSIGHGFMQATPLQMAEAVATLANRGIRYMPYLLFGEQLPGKNYTQLAPIAIDPVTLQNKQNWDIVINAMQQVTSTPGGTAYKVLKNTTYTIAGKTGTAAILSKRLVADEEDKQDAMPEKFRDHHLFIAFAPVDKPKIAIAVISENSSVAMDATRTIFDFYLGNKNANRHTEIKIQKAAT